MAGKRKSKRGRPRLPGDGSIYVRGDATRWVKAAKEIGLSVTAFGRQAIEAWCTLIEVQRKAGIRPQPGELLAGALEARGKVDAMVQTLEEAAAERALAPHEDKLLRAWAPVEWERLSRDRPLTEDPA